MKNYKQLLSENLDWVKSTFEKTEAKMSILTKRMSDIIPYTTDKDGKNICRHISWWTNGFWGGLNWLLYSYTKNEDYKTTAKNSEKLLDAALADYNRLDHDVGFLWYLLSGASYNLTGDPDSKTRALFAATSLSSRFVLGGDFIRAWNSPTRANWTIIDCMMNLPLLYWASEQIGDDRFKRIAIAHAEMTLCDHLREDGSVAHIVEHDRETGEVITTYGGQGYGEGSSWSRGQAWALYGFVISYIHTKDERYLNAAKQVANYFIASCCDDWLPRIDFRSPSEPVYYDSSAGACAACGLIELAKILPENEGGMYANAAFNILKAMTDKFCSFDPNTDYVLGFGAAAYPHKPEQEEEYLIGRSLVYADYFYIEALLKLLGSEFFTW